jgi:hypothetical protein
MEAGFAVAVHGPRHRNLRSEPQGVKVFGPSLNMKLPKPDKALPSLYQHPHIVLQSRQTCRGGLHVDLVDSFSVVSDFAYSVSVTP